MHALGLLLIIAFIIFIVPIIGIFQLILRFFFGKKNSVRNPFGQQGQNNKGRTTWYTHTKKNKKVIQDDEGEYIDFEDIISLLSIFYFTDKISSTIKLLYPRQGKAPRYSLYFSST